jgi:hypothetical protein
LLTVVPEYNDKYPLVLKSDMPAANSLVLGQKLFDITETGQVLFDIEDNTR